MPVAALLGTGLIGASIGIGLRSLGWTVAGWDPAEDAGTGAIRCGAVDRLAASVDEALNGGFVTGVGSHSDRAFELGHAKV